MLKKNTTNRGSIKIYWSVINNLLKHIWCMCVSKPHTSVPPNLYRRTSFPICPAHGASWSATTCSQSAVSARSSKITVQMLEVGCQQSTGVYGHLPCSAVSGRVGRPQAHLCPPCAWSGPPPLGDYRLLALWEMRQGST